MMPPMSSPCRSSDTPSPATFVLAPTPAQLGRAPGQRARSRSFSEEDDVHKDPGSGGLFRKSADEEREK